MPDRVTVVLIRLFAVFVLLTAFGNISNYGFAFSDSSEKIWVFVIALGFDFLVPSVIAYLLWHYPQKILPETPNTPGDGSDDQLSPNKIVEIGAFLLGLYFLVFAVSYLFYFVSLDLATILSAENNDAGYSATESRLAEGVIFLIQAGLSLALIFGRRKIARSATQSESDA